jgi:hypothetical protein
LAVAVAYFRLWLGVKVTFKVRLPAFKMEPAFGEYAKVPGTLAVASSCVALKDVGYVTGAGIGQLTVLANFCAVVVCVRDAAR